jgi:hypothetical protein
MLASLNFVLQHTPWWVELLDALWIVGALIAAALVPNWRGRIAVLVAAAVIWGVALFVEFWVLVFIAIASHAD